MPIGRRAIVAEFLLLPGMVLIEAAPGRAEDAELARAAQFIRNSGNRLAALARGNPAAEEKQRRLLAFLEDVVDVDGVARFCLGRFWRAATPAQQAEVPAPVPPGPGQQRQPADQGLSRGRHAGEHRPAGAQRRGHRGFDHCTRTGEGDAPLRVTWVIGTDTGRLLIVDIVAEGMSLRLTQRSDYSAFLGRNNDNLDTLLRALRQQTGGG